MNGTSPAIQGFMIPVNQLDFATILLSGATRNICSSSMEATLGAPWYACENIQFKGTVDAVTARVGDSVTIQVGLQGLPSPGGLPQVIVSVGAWVCYPNTVTGGADSSLVVPSMQPPNPFPNYAWSLPTPIADAPRVYNNMTYHAGNGFLWQSLGPWIPQEDDFMDQSEHGGHCCIIANASGLFNWQPTSSDGPLGFQITAISELNAHIDVCTDLYQGQRNVIIVPAVSGGRGSRVPPRIGFLSGAPKQRTSFKTSVAVTAIKQGDGIDPALLEALKSGAYAGLPLKPASLPPRSLHLARHECGWNGWLSKIIHEAEEIVEELLGLDLHPFGGGHQLHLSLPAQGLQPLHLEVELDPNEPRGTVHSIEIRQTDANGARGGIRAGIVVT
jgi:hypothetical protein